MKSLRSQLLLIFLAFVLISFLTALYTAYYYNRKGEISITSGIISDIEITLLESLKEQENYYNFETVSANYFETKQSSYLDKYQTNYSNLLDQLKVLSEQNIDEESSKEIETIVKKLNQLNSLFQQMTLSILKRGFKNFGIEGEMRVLVHELENIEELDQKRVLTLRRHEKDFIIRQESTYIEKHKEEAKRIKSEIENNNNLSLKRKRAILDILIAYETLFDQIAIYERMIGLKSNTGLKKKLNDEANQLLNELDQLKSFVSKHQKIQLSQLNTVVGTFAVFYLLSALVLCYRIATRFTKRLKTLSSRINYFVNTNFTARLKLNEYKSENEVGKLWNNFIKMEQEIVEYIDLFKEKVDEKTLELSYKNEKIELQKQELQQKKEESEEKNKDLLDGMRYGWRIQRALLPTASRLKKQLKESFVFFSPKDIVSGDIYWTHKTGKKEKEENIFSVIDCTGHGVPGAFMSILAVNALNDAILNKEHIMPSKTLKTVNNYVFNTMKYYSINYDDYHTKDGMDMLVCKLNRDQLKLEYSGANRPLYIVRKYKKGDMENINLKEKDYKYFQQSNAIIFEIFPTKKTVGTLNEKESKVFENKEITVKQGDMLYLTSDGYADQFGGPKNKKFMISRLKNMLLLIHDLPMDEQKSILKQTLQEWKNDEEQIDDITVLGIRV